MKRKHSKLPWEIKHTRAGYKVMSKYDFICENIDEFAVYESDFSINKTDIANAEFITHACNNHYQLLDTLKEVLSEDDKEEGVLFNSTRRLIEEAIKQAEGD